MNTQNPSPQPLSRKGRGAKYFIGCVLLVLLAGCSAPLKSDLPNEQVYRLAPVVDIAARRLPLTLYVPPLTATPALDSARISLIKPPSQQDFIAHSRWPDELPSYLHALILEGLARSEGFQAVSEQRLGRDTSLKLLLRVTDFQAEYSADGKDEATIVVGITATLLKDSHLLKQEHYEARQTHVALRTGSIVAAMNQALSEVMAALLMDLQRAL